MQLETLKAIYRNAYETVVITDDTLHLLWQNRPSELLSAQNLRSLFGSVAPTDLQNGPHFTRIDGDLYRFGVLRVPAEDAQGDLLVLTLDDADVIQSMLRCRDVREYVENYTGEIRQSVTGVAMAANILYELLGKEQSAHEQTDWLNVIMGHCYRLLKSATSISDTVHNAEQNDATELIPYSEFLRTFAEVCGRLLGENAVVSCNAADSLYVSVPSSRLLNCLLQLLLCARGTRSDWDSFSLTAYPEDGFVVTEITAASSERARSTAPAISDTCPLYEGGENHADEYLIRRFCERYGGKVKIRQTDVFCCCTLMLPAADLSQNTVCCSKAEEYATDRFSRYHIALSAWMPQRFFRNRQ